MELWEESMGLNDEDPPPSHAPFTGYKDMNATIDHITVGDVPWQCFVAEVRGEVPDDAAKWLSQGHKVYFRHPGAVIDNILKNPSFNGEIDYAPYISIDSNDKRRWSDFMSGNFSWRQADSERIHTFHRSQSVETKDTHSAHQQSL